MIPSLIKISFDMLYSYALLHLPLLRLLLRFIHLLPLFLFLMVRFLLLPLCLLQSIRTC